MIALIIVSVSQKPSLLCRPWHGEPPPSFAVLSHDTRVPGLLSDTGATLMSREKGKKMKVTAFFWREISKARSFLSKKQVSTELCPPLHTFTETDTVCVTFFFQLYFFRLFWLNSTGCGVSTRRMRPRVGLAEFCCCDSKSQ